MDWTLQPGDRIRRKDLHQRYGGSSQSGIAPSNRSRNILIFTDRAAGEQHGYLDRWDQGILHYSGEGQIGNQQLSRGNRAILHHAEDGRSLRVFQGVRGVVQYVGEFELDEPPYYWTDAPESGSSRSRKVIIFRLRPVSEDSARTQHQGAL